MARWRLIHTADSRLCTVQATMELVNKKDKTMSEPKEFFVTGAVSLRV